MPPVPVEYRDLHWSADDGMQMAGRQWLSASTALRGAVLIVHGMGDHSGRYERMANRFAESGWSVFAPDLRGHGRSSGTRGYFPNIESLHSDLKGCLQRTQLLAEGLPLFIYGQSFGGLLAIDFALQCRPQLTGLIASSPALQIAMPAPDWKVSVGRVLRKIAPRLGLKSGLSLEELSDNPQVASRTRSDGLRHGKITAPAYFGMIEAGERCMASTEQLPCPSLILHGKQDRITDFHSSQRFAECRPSCEFLSWTDGKHELHNMSYGDEVIDRQLAFFEQQIETRKELPT